MDGVGQVSVDLLAAALQGRHDPKAFDLIDEVIGQRFGIRLYPTDRWRKVLGY